MNANSTAVNTTTQKSYSAPVNNPLDSLPKAYGAGSPQTKQLGGDPALAQWYSEATAWYQAAISGQIEANPADVQQVASYLQWAAQQMGMGPQWDPTMGGQGMPGQSAMPQEMHYDFESNEITATGGEVTHRSWGLDDTLTVPSMAADVEYIWTTDDTVSPPKQVLKVVITNEITGAKEVVIFENADDPDFKLNILSPKPDTQIHGTAPGIDITTGEYDMDSTKDGGTSGEASVEGVYNEDTGVWEYEANSMQEADKVDFSPEGSDDPTEVQYHEVYGWVNINPKPSDAVYVSKDAEGNVVIRIVHKNGSEDLITAMKGTRMVNINSDPLNTFWGEPPEAHDKVPGAFAEDVTMLGEEGEKSGGVFGVLPAGFLKGMAETTQSYPDMINQMATLMGLEPAELVEKLRTLYPNLDADNDGKISGAEMEKAINEKSFPPLIPDKNLIDFFAQNDPQLQNLLDAVKGATDETSYTMLMKQVTGRIVQLLQAFYGGKVSVHKPDSNDWRHANNIVFDGVVVEAFKEPKSWTEPITGQPLITDWGPVGESTWKLFPDVPV